MYTLTVTVKLEGITAPLQIHADTVNDLRKHLQQLQQHDLLVAQPAAPIQWSYTPEGLPICPKHGAPMKKREKQGDCWHSHNLGTEGQPLYCRGYPGKESPGYDH